MGCLYQYVHLLNALLQALLNFHDASLLSFHLCLNLRLRLLQILLHLDELLLYIANLLGEVAESVHGDRLLGLTGLFHLSLLLLLKKLLIGRVLILRKHGEYLLVGRIHCNYILLCTGSNRFIQFI